MNPWTDAERHARRAHRFYETGRWRLALSELKLAIEKDPDQAEWYVGLGLTLEALNRFREAADAFRIVTELRDSDKDAWIHLGVNELRNNQTSDAIDAFNQATELDRNAVAPYSHRILAYAMVGAHEQAELQFYFAINLADEPCATAYDHLGHSLAIRGRFQEAAAAWTTCLEIDPTYPDAQACLARALWRDDQLESASHAFRRHLAIENEDTTAMLDLARLNRARGLHEQAIKHLKSIVDIDAGSDDAWHTLGDIYAETDQTAKAEEAYGNALILNPGRPGVRLGLAQLRTDQHDTIHALELLQDELACDGQNPKELIATAELLVRCDATGRAAGLISSLLSDPSIVLDEDLQLVCHLLRAKCAAASDQHRAMIADLRQITRLMPTHAEAWRRLAEAYTHINRFDRAAAALRRARCLTSDTNGSLAQLNRHISKRRLIHRLRRVVPLAA